MKRTAAQIRTNHGTPVASSLPMLLLRSREAVMRAFRPILRGQDLTEQQWRTLRALSEGGDLEMLELARATVLRPPSLLRIVRALESRGMVRREPILHDMRRTLVVLQPEGEAMLGRLWPLAEAVYEDIERRLGSDRLALLYKISMEVEAALTEEEAPAQAHGTGRTTRPTQPVEV